MPERKRAVERLVQLLHNDGHVFVWDGRVGMLAPGQAVAPDDYDQLAAAADAVWVDVVERVNWNRVLLTASAVHLGKQEDHDAGRGPEHADSDIIGHLCGLCLLDALLTKEHML